MNGRKQVDLCGSGMIATINEPWLRTTNRLAQAQSDYDIYKHNPWRAPGSAPVLDACGAAGGQPWALNVTAEYGVGGCQRTGCWYTNTEYAMHGDLGSVRLEELPTDTAWTIGGEAEVIWQILANHGGGYRKFNENNFATLLSCSYLRRSIAPLSFWTERLMTAACLHGMISLTAPNNHAFYLLPERFNNFYSTIKSTGFAPRTNRSPRPAFRSTPWALIHRATNCNSTMALGKTSPGHSWDPVSFPCHCYALSVLILDFLTRVLVPCDRCFSKQMVRLLFRWNESGRFNLGDEPHPA